MFLIACLMHPLRCDEMGLERGNVHPLARNAAVLSHKCQSRGLHASCISVGAGTSEQAYDNRIIDMDRQLVRGC